MYYQKMLFDLPPAQDKPDEPSGGTPRLKRPQRMQMEFTTSSLDDLISTDHIARTIWAIVCKLNLSEFLDEIKAVEGVPGRPPIDPRVHLALWVFATIKGIGSARTLARYCYEHLAFIWIRGGLSVNYHSLSDFRNKGDKLENLLTQIVASLIHQKVVSTENWSQDGMRVRANAGTGSFRREKSLQESVRSAEERLRQLKKDAHLDAQRLSTRQRAAKERAATECAERSRKALETLEQLKKDIDKRNRSKKEKQKLKKNARASKTDPEAKKMKMANGGYNPAYNVQYVTDNKSRIITGIQTSNEGADYGLMKPMLKHIANTYNLLPNKWLVDAGFVSEAGLHEAEEHGVEVFMPVPERSRKKYGVGGPLPNNSNVMGRWVERMETEEAKELYKDRASSAEYSNASTRNKGGYQFRVRGRHKAHATSVLFALTHNIERIISMIRSGCKLSLNFT